MKETRQRGFMKQFKTIEILSKLSGIKNSKFFIDGNSQYPPKLSNEGSSNSKFVMLAAILRTKIIGNAYNVNEQNKLCKASADTLELAANLASEPSPSNELRAAIKACNETNNKADCYPTRWRYESNKIQDIYQKRCNKSKEIKK